jgi:septum formation protein
MHQLMLASQSPRRKDLLQNAGYKFTVVPIKVSEIPDKNLNVREQILEIAGRKARAALSELLSRETRPFIVLSADTEVVLEGATLGKPATPEEAAATLRRLSGRSHEVMTAVWLIESSTSKAVSHLETTLVHFKMLSDREIQDYVATGDPMDKAGSYGIQSGAGHLIERIEGSFENVVGLPVAAVKALLKQESWTISG